MSVLYASENTVHSITKDGLTADVYSDPKMAKITDVSVDTRENKLYVSFKEAGKLIEVNSTKNDIVITNVGEPGKVAVDWITGNVYFVDATVGESYIRVCNVLKKRCARLQKLPFNCRVAALVVDPAAKRMFYCETRSGRSVVWSASLSGQYTMDLAAPGDCTGLAADSFSKRLYVAEKKPPRIISMDYNGEDQHESVQRDDVQDQCRDYECVNVCVMDKHGPICLCDDGQPANNGQCPLLEKGQLPLFNGWTYEQYRRAHNVMASMVSIIVVLLLLYLGVFIYYQYKRGRCTRPINYMEVRFQNRGEEASAAASPVDDNTEEE
ncbi:unnamed protein product [Diatraea saccharalis]|uniref:Vitellogenin receptor n=1 Tax=Diatraea saccharalis TaxID=40085 RepID=A0A9N9RAP6_9NEOP|nr:unnamed protein product [Diatraea saccharalis]